MPAPSKAILNTKPESTATAARRPAAMGFIMLTALIDMISIGLMIPVLPVLVGDFTSNLAEQAFWFGAMMVTFGVANFISSPILGALSDRYGRRPILLVGFCGMAVSLFVTALATQLWMLIAVRLVSGALMSNLSVANAYVADITAPEDRSHRFGQLGAMVGVGFITGPAMGGLLGGIDIRLPFFVAGGLALTNLLYGYFVLPESLPTERRRAVSWRAMNPFASLRELGRLQGLGGLVIVIALGALAQFIVQTSWVLFTGFRFGWGPIANGMSLFVVGSMSVLVQGMLLKRMLGYFGAPRLATIGLISSTLVFLAWALSPVGWLMYVLIACNVFGYAIVPTIQGIVSGAADARKQGQTMGALASLNSLASVVAPTISAMLLGMVSHLSPGDWRAGAPFFFCAALQFAATLIALRHFRRRSYATTPAINASISG